MTETTTAWAAAGPRAHDIGPGGIVVVDAEAAGIRIRGVDGTEARVVAPADGAGLEIVAEPGRFEVRGRRQGSHVGFVGVRIGSRGFGFPFGIATGGTIEIAVPRDARIEVQATAGDVTVVDVGGGAQVRATAGTVALTRVAGSVGVEVASGDVCVEADGPLALTARSVSGEVRASAPRFETAAIETISGAVRLAGAFGPGAVHAVSTVSGAVRLAVAGGVALELATVSGDVACSHPDRRSGDGRRDPLVIGDGSAHLAVRTLSGDVVVREAPGTRPRDPDGAVDPAALAVLEALARGEIDVAEAERRLADAAAGPLADAAVGSDAAAGPLADAAVGSDAAVGPRADAAVGSDAAVGPRADAAAGSDAVAEVRIDA
jgi:hypothetical protein